MQQLYSPFTFRIDSQEKTIQEATFNLKLSEKEKIDRSKTQLPFTRSNQNAAVHGDTHGLSSRQDNEGSDGRPKNLIYVEPGDEDTDSEEEDIDDDLDI